MKIGFLGCYSEYSHKNTFHIDFESSETILEYDMIVLDFSYLFSHYQSDGSKFNGKVTLSETSSFDIVDDIQKRKSELETLLKLGKKVLIFNCNDYYYFRYTGEKKLSGTGKNTRTTNIVTEVHPSEILPFKIKSLDLEGKNVSLNNRKIESFYNSYSSAFRYYSVYEGIDNSKVLFSIERTNKVVGFYEKVDLGAIMFLPSLDYSSMSHDTGVKKEKKYLDDIYSLFDILFDDDNEELPEFSRNYLLPNEMKNISEIDTLNMKINKLSLELEESKKRLSHLQQEKQIFTASGRLLEKMVVSELKGIGFDILKYDSEGIEEDIVLKYGNKIVVVEVKGVEGSATEKHTSQTVKWKSMYHIEHDILPKGFLVVNAFKSRKLEERQETFPSQMLKYAIQQEICLLSTIQLYNIKEYLEIHPEERDNIINELLNTNGCYNKFKNWDMVIKKVEK